MNLQEAAQIGDRVAVETLLNSGADVNLQSNGYGRTALSWAAEKGHEAVVKLLLAKDSVNPDSEDSDGRTALSWAAENGHETVVKLLLAKDGVDLNSKDRTYGQTPLSWAAENGHEAVVKLLLAKNGVDLNPKDRMYGRTPLSWAATNGHEAVVKLLLATDGVELDSDDDRGRTPLLRAAQNGYMAVRLLLAKDDVSLHVLVQEGKQRLVQLLLLSAIYDVDTRDSLSRTPLHIAISFGHLEIAAKLISSKANVNSKDSNGMTPLRLAVRSKEHDLIELLLRSSAHTKDIMVEEWLDAYGKEASNTVVKLSEERMGEKRVHFIEGIQGQLEQMLARLGTQRRLFLFTDYSLWQRSLTPDSRDTLQYDRSQIFHQERINGPGVSFSVAAWFPTAQDLGNKKQFNISTWGECGIAWTMMQHTDSNDRPCWKSIDHFSMLPYSWTPDDGVDFFTQFILYLKERWLKLCHLAEEHLTQSRLDQLREKGKNPELVHRLAEDAQKLAELRSILRGQVNTAKKFAVGHCHRYNEGKGLKDVQEAIAGISADIDSQISQLDQTVRGILQFEFAWVSINEAHRSTSIAISIKRLSWVTFIFLPAMFASSLFGMNVDLLKDSPDWRWYILFGGASLILTILGWLLFKYNPIEPWVESNVDYIRQRLGWKSITQKMSWRKPRKNLPV